jgi:hypothetical protein
LRYLQNPEERARMAERARAAATREFDERHYVSRQVSIIERLVSEAVGRPAGHRNEE